MSTLSMLFPAAVDPYREALSYEYLYSLDKSSLKTISEQTVDRGLLPTEAISEIMVFDDDLNKVKTFFDTKIGSFDVAINNTPTYPQRLADAKKRVPLIYYKGDITLIERESVSIVGARKASEKGLMRAARLGKILAENNIVVVSGLACGIDTAALSSCIKHGGQTIGVIGTPIDESYPKQNIDLQAQISREHLLVSQVPFYRYHVQPFNSKKQYFRERNVTMAAISNATVIVEASDTSGSLIQANACIQQGRPLFIMKSCLDNLSVTWPRRFVKHGAIVLEEPEQLLSVLKDS